MSSSSTANQLLYERGGERNACAIDRAQVFFKLTIVNPTRRSVLILKEVYRTEHTIRTVWLDKDQPGDQVTGPSASVFVKGNQPLNGARLSY